MQNIFLVCASTKVILHPLKLSDYISILTHKAYTVHYVHVLYCSFFLNLDIIAKTCVYTKGYTNWASTRENLTSGGCEQQRRRHACTSVESDQHLCYSLIGNGNTSKLSLFCQAGYGMT